MRSTQTGVIPPRPSGTTIGRAKTVSAPGTKAGPAAEPAPVSLKPKGLSLGIKYTILSALAVIIATIILVFSAYFSIRQEVESEIDNSGIMLTKVLASFDPSFWENNTFLERTWSDVIGPKMKIQNSSIIDLVILKGEGKEEVQVASMRKSKEYTLSSPRPLIDRLGADDIKINEVLYSPAGSEGGTRIRSYKKPIRDEAGNDSGYSVNLYLSERKIDDVLNNLFGAFIVPALVAIIIGAILGLVMAYQTTMPLKHLMSDMEKVSQGNLEHRAETIGSDEIAVLTEVFNKMTRGLKVAHQKELASKALEMELNVAHEIQAHLLPKNIQEIPGYDISTFYRASKEVGGDYYDIIPLNETKVGIIVADVSGKSIPGSMVMTMTRSLLRMEATRNLSPADTLVKVNRILAGDIRRGMFVTVLYFVLDTQDHSVLVSSAGHNPLVIWRKAKQTYELVNPQGIALGFDRGPVFERTIKEDAYRLTWGDRLVAYTDGVVESMSPRRQEFGNERFFNLINQLGETDSKAFITQVVKSLDAHQGTAPQHDDITLLSIRFSG